MMFVSMGLTESLGARLGAKEDLDGKCDSDPASAYDASDDDNSDDSGSSGSGCASPDKTRSLRPRMASVQYVPPQSPPHHPTAPAPSDGTCISGELVLVLNQKDEEDPWPGLVLDSTDPGVVNFFEKAEPGHSSAEGDISPRWTLNHLADHVPAYTVVHLDRTLVVENYAYSTGGGLDFIHPGDLEKARRALAEFKRSQALPDAEEEPSAPKKKTRPPRAKKQARNAKASSEFTRDAEGNDREKAKRAPDDRHCHPPATSEDAKTGPDDEGWHGKEGDRVYCSCHPDTAAWYVLKFTGKVGLFCVTKAVAPSGVDSLVMGKITAIREAPPRGSRQIIMQVYETEGDPKRESCLQARWHLPTRPNHHQTPHDEILAYFSKLTKGRKIPKATAGQIAPRMWP